jgi:hypothetical protein
MKNLMTAAPVKPIAQPDGISCGATSVIMVIRALEFHPALQIPDVKKAVRTNPRTGTVPKGIIDGLAGLGIDAQFARPGSIAKLHSIIRGSDEAAPQYALLRLLIGGGAKHWVVVDGIDRNGQLAVVDPGSGARARYGDMQIEGWWRRRHWDCVLISADPQSHPAQKSAGVKPGEVRPAPGPASITSTTLADWCGGLPIIPESAYTKQESQAITDAGTAIERASKDPYLVEIPYRSIRKPELTFWVEGGSGMLETMVVKNQTGHRVIGGIANGIVWVTPEFRDIGIGPEILIAAHSQPQHVFTDPSSFSIEGYKARLKAHRLALQEAMSQGEKIPPEVMSDYRVQDDGKTLSLASPTWDGAWRAALNTGGTVISPRMALGTVDETSNAPKI